MANEKIKLGKNGEEKGACLLQQQGYEILKRNYRCRLGEIDIIAREKDCIVFVEVKTRKTKSQGLPEEAVNQYKQHQIEKVALHWLKSSGFKHPNLRFDVISVSPEGIHLLKDAFRPTGKYTY